MYETKEKLEKVILVAVSTDSGLDAEESLDELEELVNFHQRRHHARLQ